MFDLSPVNHRAVPGGLYVSSVLDAARHAQEPNYAYLFGETQSGGWWYYFPVAASYKIPLPTAGILLLGVASLFWRKPAREELSLAIPAAVYFIFLLTQPIQIGWRHALPAYLPLIMLASRGATFRHKLMTAAYWLLATLTLIDSTRHHPDYVAYFNRPLARPYEILSDSNLDWGQSLKPAGRWIDDNRDWIAGRPVHVRPFAVSNRGFRRYVGDRARHLRFGDLPPTSGVLIVSPVCLSGVSESADEYSFLRGVPPLGRIGRTLYVYDLDRLGRRN